MANKIPTEIVIKILNNVQSTQDLYSSLLVNRIWCKVTMPILWEFPLGQECCINNKNKLKKKALCIRTYISCMDTQARTLLIQNGFDLSLSPPQATFDYPSFTHNFIINNLVYFTSTYLLQSSQQKIIGLDQDNNYGYYSYEEIADSRILFREMCRLIINRCTFLVSFKITGFRYIYKNLRNSIDLIGSIIKLPNALKVFKKLESFTSMIRDNEPIFPLYESLELICDNILNMDLSLFSNSQEQLFAKLISVQKRLENLSISGADFFLDYNSIFWAIISQKETLKSLRFKTVSFSNFERKSSPIGQFTSLKELYIENCFGLHKSDGLFFASSFPQLSSFHFRHKYNKFPNEFIIKIFETANTKLRNIYLDSCTTDTFLAILNYCTNITKLTLPFLRTEQVMEIFNNNFNELRRLSFDCEYDANKLLCEMAENVPKSLETIEIGIGEFSADSLRNFFEGWCCRGGNKKIIVKRIEQARLFTLSDEHFKVIKEYGVQFKNNIE